VSHDSTLDDARTRSFWPFQLARATDQHTASRRHKHEDCIRETAHGSIFTANRPVMMAAAFHITGSRDDAEDVVQSAWETWSRIDVATVHNPPAFLSVMTGRLALNAVRTQRRRRETYLGPWLPDPIVDDGSPEWAVLHRDGLGQALDFVLSTLTPEQATAYVLRKVLEVDYESIAEIVEVSPAAARQLVSRAQRAVTASLGTLHGDQRSRDGAALSALADAVISGDVMLIAALLSPEATLYSDGGGAVNAALRPVHGAEKIARFLVGIAAQPGVVLVPSVINGSAGLVIEEGANVTTTVSLRAGLDGIVAMYFVRNPDKLRRVQP